MSRAPQIDKHAADRFQAVAPAPGPFNTPSLRKESANKEPDAAPIVPAKHSGPVWGGSAQKPPAETTAVAAATAASATARQREDEALAAMEEAHKLQVEAAKAVEEAVARAAAAKARAERVAAAAELPDRDPLDDDLEPPPPTPVPAASNGVVSPRPRAAESAAASRARAAAAASSVTHSPGSRWADDDEQADLASMPAIRLPAGLAMAQEQRPLHMRATPPAAYTALPAAPPAPPEPADSPPVGIVYVDEEPASLSLGERVERIKVELGLDMSLLLLPSVQAANAAMGIQGRGPLPQQVRDTHVSFCCWRRASTHIVVRLCLLAVVTREARVPCVAGERSPSGDGTVRERCDPTGRDPVARD